MATCKHIIWTRASGASYVSYKRRPCGRKATHFFRVTYSELHPYLRNQTKMDDVFGFCEEHAVNRDTPEGYASITLPDYRHESTPIMHLRGEVISVCRVQDVSEAVKDVDYRLMNSFEAKFRRIMSQENATKMTPEMWQEIFINLYEEFVVKSVQNA